MSLFRKGAMFYTTSNAFMLSFRAIPSGHDSRCETITMPWWLIRQRRNVQNQASDIALTLSKHSSLRGVLRLLLEREPSASSTRGWCPSFPFVLCSRHTTGEERSTAQKRNDAASLARGRRSANDGGHSTTPSDRKGPRVVHYHYILFRVLARPPKIAAAAACPEGKKKERGLLPHEEDSPRSLNALRHAAA